ncbi:MAG: hypothetical protein IH987_13910 [Planctomycetes bacterium]|nr:hypothetical protein [Planctomycetota bacterium]
MDSNTKKILIGVCVVGFILTSTFSWGIISGAVDLVQEGVDLSRVLTAGSIAWILAHANALVPLIFVGVIVWVVRHKSTE